MDESPTDTVPPPSYLSIQEFDQKTSQAIQLSSSSTHPVAVDEDGWPIYDPTAFEAVAESYNRSPPASSSAAVFSAESLRHERQRQPSSGKGSSSTRFMKSRSSERPTGNPGPGHEFSSVPRADTPPPPFTATGPSLDGPPFEEVVQLSYNGSDSQAASPIEPSYSPPPRSPPPPPRFQPVEPLRVPRQRLSDSRLQAPPNPFPPRRSTPILSDLRPNPTSAITRVEFDPQTAYSPYGGVGNHTTIQAGAAAFYNHAVASQLTTSPTIPTSVQSANKERISSPYSSGYAPTAQHATSSVSVEQFGSRPQGFRFVTAAAPPPLSPQPQSASPPSSAGYSPSQSGSGRGPLPPVPSSNVPLGHSGGWGGSDARLVQDIHGGR
ncbi:hypothetical protein BC826DRAFT_980190 [Russula brevipes]|nr:hypothetical protein BC826DRAFT_980190 [Russula brevipes]